MDRKKYLLFLLGIFSTVQLYTQEVQAIKPVTQEQLEQRLQDFVQKPGWAAYLLSPKVIIPCAMVGGCIWWCMTFASPHDVATSQGAIAKHGQTRVEQLERAAQEGINKITKNNRAAATALQSAQCSVVTLEEKLKQIGPQFDKVFSSFNELAPLGASILKRTQNVGETINSNPVQRLVQSAQSISKNIEEELTKGLQGLQINMQKNAQKIGESLQVAKSEEEQRHYQRIVALESLPPSGRSRKLPRGN